MQTISCRGEASGLQLECESWRCGISFDAELPSCDQRPTTPSLQIPSILCTSLQNSVKSAVVAKKSSVQSHCDSGTSPASVASRRFVSGLTRPSLESPARVPTLQGRKRRQSSRSWGSGRGTRGHVPTIKMLGEKIMPRKLGVRWPNS
jgi:hypothetical protein